MKPNTCFLLLVLSIVAFMGCSPAISVDMSGSWTATNTIETSTDETVYQIGSISTASCTIADKEGVLSINNFTMPGYEFIDWNAGYGARSEFSFSMNVTGSYLNPSMQTVSVVITFDGTIAEDEIRGAGDFIQTMSVSGVSVRATGTSNLVKG